MLDVCLLGTGGMMPMPGRFLASMIARLNGKMIIIDCGEGTQVTLKMLGWGFKSMEAILFTHYHADHISGLPGMLLTIGNSGRIEPLKLIGPKGLTDVVEGLRKISPELPFPIEYIELDEGVSAPIKWNGFQIDWIKADHIIRCVSYKITIRRKGRFDPKKAINMGIPKNIWSQIQKNGSAEYEGKIYHEDMVMGKERKGIKVSYCTDTRPAERLIEFIRDSDLFICEGMYGEEEKKKKAIENKHMLFSEAAMLAQKGEVHELWLTHFSPSLSEPELFIENASKIFNQVTIGYDRIFKTIYFKDSEEEHSLQT